METNITIIMIWCLDKLLITSPHSRNFSNGLIIIINQIANTWWAGMSRWSWGYEEPPSQDHRNYSLTSGAPPYPSPKQLTTSWNPSTSCRLIHEVIVLIPRPSRLSKLTFLHKVRLCAQWDDHFPVFFLRHLFYIPIFPFVRRFAFSRLCTQLTILSFVEVFDYTGLRILNLRLSRFSNLCNFLMNGS